MNELTRFGPRKRTWHTKRQLALIAWSITHMPPGCSFAEGALLTEKLIAGLSPGERGQVETFLDDTDAQLRALKRRGRARPWR
jgi:hypothetical protein